MLVWNDKWSEIKRLHNIFLSHFQSLFQFSEVPIAVNSVLFNQLSCSQFLLCIDLMSWVPILSQEPMIQWLSYVAVCHIFILFIVCYIIRPIVFLFELFYLCHFLAFYSWLWGLGLTHCWIYYRYLYSRISLSFGQW